MLRRRKLSREPTMNQERIHGALPKERPGRSFGTPFFLKLYIRHCFGLERPGRIFGSTRLWVFQGLLSPSTVKSLNYCLLSSAARSGWSKLSKSMSPIFLPNEFLLPKEYILLLSRAMWGGWMMAWLRHRRGESLRRTSEADPNTSPRDEITKTSNLKFCNKIATDFVFIECLYSFYRSSHVSSKKISIKSSYLK